MKTTFSIRLIASDHLFYDGPCTGVIIPALDGQREVLAHHESVIMAIDCGELKIKMPDGTWQIAIVGSGFARVSHGRVYVLVDTAERPEEIDVKRAQEAKSVQKNNSDRNKAYRNTIFLLHPWHVQCQD